MTSRLSLLLLVLGLALAGPAFGQGGNAPSQTVTPSVPPKAATASSPQGLFKRLAPSVFVVESMNGSGSVVATGSGVAVTPEEVVTNKHVIKEGVAWRVRHGSKTWPATLTQLDPDHDLCQIEADGLKAAPVTVRASSTLAVGERVYAIGAPEGLELTLSEGLISGLREYEQVRLIQTSAAISPGSSGGGLFDAQGRLVGITTFFLKEGQNLNFALPGEWVQALATQQRQMPHSIVTAPSAGEEESNGPIQCTAQGIVDADGVVHSMGGGPEKYDIISPLESNASAPGAFLIRNGTPMIILSRHGEMRRVQTPRGTGWTIKGCIECHDATGKNIEP